MDFSKLKNKLLIILCVFVVFFPFWCIKGLCAEDVNIERLEGIHVSSTGNYFVSGQSVGYFQLEPGFIYHISYPRFRHFVSCY